LKIKKRGEEVRGRKGEGKGKKREKYPGSGWVCIIV